MAANRGGGLAVAGCNFVSQDEIWKSHVRQEITAARKWPQNWDFMTTKYDEMVKDEVPRKDKPKPQIHLPRSTPEGQRITVEPSPKPVPQTTSSMIGWRSADRRYALERYGKYAKPKGGLVKQLNWPPEGID